MSGGQANNLPISSISMDEDVERVFAISSIDMNPDDIDVERVFAIEPCKEDEIPATVSLGHTNATDNVVAEA